MNVLNKEQILKADDLKTETVSVPEWGGDVLVRALSGTERDRFESMIVSGQGRNQKVNTENVRAKLVALVAVGEDGKRLFSDADVAALGKKNAAPLERVFKVGMRLSGLSQGDVDDMTESLGDAQGDDSITA